VLKGMFMPHDIRSPRDRRDFRAHYLRDPGNMLRNLNALRRCVLQSSRFSQPLVAVGAVIYQIMQKLSGSKWRFNVSLSRF
jgi:hypothetical protein